MEHFPIVAIAPDQPFPAGSLTEEEANGVRAQHDERVEEWLDECEFLKELFELHAKYGIDRNEEGYLAYRNHLRQNYNARLAILGPIVDPVSEDCDCIFCRLHAQDQPNEQQAEPKPQQNTPATQTPKRKPKPNPPIQTVRRSDAKKDPQPRRRQTATPSRQRLATSAAKKKNRVLQIATEPLMGAIEKKCNAAQWHCRDPIRRDLRPAAIWAERPPFQDSG